MEREDVLAAFERSVVKHPFELCKWIVILTDDKQQNLELMKLAGAVSAQLKKERPVTSTSIRIFTKHCPQVHPGAKPGK